MSELRQVEAEPCRDIQLPKNWKLKSLGELSYVKSGGTPLRSKKKFWDEGHIPWYSSGELNDLFTKESERFITDKGLEGSNAKLFPKGSLLIGMYDTAALKMSILDRAATFNQAIAGVKASDNLNIPFILHAINSMKPELLNQRRGVRQKNLSLTKIKEIKIPIPPLETQKQIVAVLDKAFAAIDLAKANIEKNLQNAKELFQSKLNQIFTQKGDGWEEKKLGDITSKIGSGATPKGGQASYKESGISLIRSMNVHDGGFREKKLAFIDDEQAGKLNNVTVEENDVLLNITGASVARCCLVEKEYLPARVNQHVSIIRLADDVMLKEFLHYSLTAKYNKDLLLGIGEQGVLISVQK